MSMTIDDMIAVLQGYKNGEEVQYFDGKWRDVKNPCWDFYTTEYRIKPVTNKDRLLNKLKAMDNETLVNFVITDCERCLARNYCSAKSDKSCCETRLDWLNEKGAN